MVEGSLTDSIHAILGREKVTTILDCLLHYYT